MKVRDAMTGDVLTMTPGRSLRDAAKFMADHNVGAVVIMDPEQPGPGIFTERDLVRSIGKGENPDDEHVAEHLTVHAAFADIEWDLEEAADTMAKGGFRHLVVVSGGELVRDHLDARHHAGVATERTSRSDFVDAVAEARRIRGSVNLEPADSRRWSAIVAAVDGSLELRMAEPPRRRLRRAGDERGWPSHGFAQAVDCWVLPLDASAPTTRRPRAGVTALAGAHGLAADDVGAAYVGRGVPAASPAVGAARRARRGGAARRSCAASSTGCTSSAAGRRRLGVRLGRRRRARAADRAPAPRRSRQRDRPVARAAHARRLSRGRRRAAAAGRGDWPDARVAPALHPSAGPARLGCPGMPSVAIVGGGFGGVGAAALLRARRLHGRDAVRARRAPRRRLASQHVSGRGVRHPVAPVRVLVRAEPELVAPLRAAGRDPGLRRGRRAALGRAGADVDRGAVGALGRRALGAGDERRRPTSPTC